MYSIGDSERYDEETCKGVLFEGIETADFVARYQAYPNPFSEYLKVAPAGWDEIRVFDMSGTLRHQTPFPADSAVDLGWLEEGVYLLWLRKGEYVMSEEIIKL